MKQNIQISKCHQGIIIRVQATQSSNT